MIIEFKDIILLGLGTVIGLIAGIAIYWLPLGQFLNEWCSIWHLIHTRYKVGQEVIIQAGIDLKPVDLNQNTLTTVRDTKMKIWHDEGVGWHHTHTGWRRARILHVFPEGNGIQNVYRVCHFDLK